MRIAYISDGVLPSLSANAVQILQMASSMGQLGHEVTVLTPWHPGAATGRKFDSACAALALGSEFSLRYLRGPTFDNGRFSGSFGVLAACVARASCFDLVYTRNVRIASFATRIGCRVIQESHAPHGPEVSGRQHKAALRIAQSNRLARWVFISARLKELVSADVQLPNERCLVEHDAVDLARFEPVISRAQARAALGLRASTPLVVHSGHLYQGRGAEHLLEVAKRLPHTDFLFLGGLPEDISRLRQEADANGLRNLTFTGHLPLPRLPLYLFAANVLVMPYTSRTVTSDRKTQTIEYASPMKMFEYMAAGRGIVATGFPAIGEVLRDGANARIVRPDSPDSLLAGVQELLERSDFSDVLGAQARRDVNAHTWEGRAQRILCGIGQPGAK